ncbi:MAG: class I SAM-dependent methyltransferase [Treponema sp.]|nr:class I SAM-dependent methyltransferase [Treponema sp.]
MRDEKKSSRFRIQNSEAVDLYANREVTFRYRGRSYIFALSQGLFSSADVDTGSRFLLKIFSDYLDNFPDKNRLMSTGFPAGSSDSGNLFTILDAGCGTGVLGICAAGALSALAPPDTEDTDTAVDAKTAVPCAKAAFHIRAQDRDELARVFTEYNASINGLTAGTIDVHTEPLLAGPSGNSWDIILSNIPAKAGLPVLEDFITRSAGLLKKNGLVFLVAVNTLADFFRTGINAAATLNKEVTGKEHTVFVYGPPENTAQCRDSVITIDENFPLHYPFYIRNRNDYEMEKLRYHLDTVHGAPDFDSSGGAVQTAAKLAIKINLAEKIGGREKPFLLHEDAQGHFVVWLARYLEAAGRFTAPPVGACPPIPPVVLSGRNILALAAARHNLWAVQVKSTIVPAADIWLDSRRLSEAAEKGKNPGTATGCSFIGFFPEMTPVDNFSGGGTGNDTRGANTAWEGLAALTASGGIVITGMGSSESERFDRKKHPAFVRLGNIKRKGFQALAYLKS